MFTAAAYRGPAEDEPFENYQDRLQFTDNARKLGPGCIVVGIIMLVAGFSLCILTKRARRKQQTVGFHCPLHGDFYPLSPGVSTKTLSKFRIKTCKISCSVIDVFFSKIIMMISLIHLSSVQKNY